MPPPLALALTVAGCAFLIWRDSRRTSGLSGALWLPVIWIFLIASRFPTQWLELFSLSVPGHTSVEDGNPVDALFFAVFILAAVAVLVRRRIAVSSIARNNVWLSVFFIYCFLAILWSDFPFVAFKRWIKVLGHPVMTLIILTEERYIEAVRRVLKRSTFLLIPSSILCIKYYPQIARYFDPYTGRAANCGIHLNKNELGYVCMVFGLFFFWNLLSARRFEIPAARREETLLSIAFLAMIGWLTVKADSATALACTAVGVLTMAVVGARMVRNRLWTCVVVGLLLVAAAEASFGVYSRVVDLLGRDATLTDRTQVWHDVLAMGVNPVLGAGFESFWLGPRLDAMWSKWWWRPIQAHNGYIETYVNLGAVGVGLLAVLLVATFEKGRQELMRNVSWGRFRLAVLVMILVYNYTEASFRALSLVWTIFHLIAIDLPENRGLRSQTRPGPRAVPARLPVASRAAAPGRPAVTAVRPLPASVRARR